MIDKLIFELSLYLLNNHIFIDFDCDSIIFKFHILVLFQLFQVKNHRNFSQWVHFSNIDDLDLNLVHLSDLHHLTMHSVCPKVRLRDVGQRLCSENEPLDVHHNVLSVV